jgi:tRNA nucleotidyltransferase (CCA-adding enzyme)
MHLPESVRRCVDALENAGYSCYAVGGCVRDACLGRSPQDYDLCTAAKPAKIKEIFSEHSLVLAGEKHGTVGVVTDGGVVEITTYRCEGEYKDSRHPQWVEFVEDIEADLSRRDFTVNAMAYSPIRGFADPFGGQQDLKDGILRAVGDPYVRFQEDALRILRGVRFSVRFRLTPEKTTLQAMEQLAPTMDNLARERVFDELCKLLPLVTVEDLLCYAPILTQVIPELAPTVDFSQRSPHHAYPLYTHIAHTVAATEADLTLRWAALLHDIGKIPTFTQDENGRGHFYGHAEVSADMADAVLLRLKTPTALRERVVFLIRHHMLPLEPNKKLLRRRLSQYGKDALLQLLALQEADFQSKGVEEEEDPSFSQSRALLQEILEGNSCLTVRDLAVSGHDLMALGYSGKALGEKLEQLLLLVLDESVPNEKAALLAACQKEVSL